MPGLLLKGPWRPSLEIDPPPPPASISDLLHRHQHQQNSLDKLYNEQQAAFCAPAAACLSPLTPSKHKACRPSQSLQSILNLTELSESKKSPCPGQCTSDQGGDSGDHDLAEMVHEFIENGSREADQCDSEGDCSSSTKLCDNLKVLCSSRSFLEAELVSKVSSVLLAVGEDSLICVDDPGNDCKGACLRHLVVKHLRSMGFDAAICKLKWQISGNVPGGDYEYVDVVFDKDGTSATTTGDHRLILDLDFQSQFEIARPTQSYRAALKLLPAVYVGTVKRLHRILEIMSEAAKCSLTQNSMHLPPWRTIEYMFAKWLSSPHERSSNKVVPLGSGSIASSASIASNSNSTFSAAAAAGAAMIHPSSATRSSARIGIGISQQSSSARYQAQRRFCCADGGTVAKPCCDQLKRIKEALRSAAAAAAVEIFSSEKNLTVHHQSSKQTSTDIQGAASKLNNLRFSLCKPRGYTWRTD